MATIFSKYKDTLLNLIEGPKMNDIKYPLRKTGNVFNGYTRGDYIVVGGRKTSGKGSFIMNNYVISPLVQRRVAGQKFSKEDGPKPFDMKVIYINTKKPLKAVMDRLIVNYSSYESGGNKVGVPTLCGLEGNHMKMPAVKAKQLASNMVNLFDAFINGGHLNVICSSRTIYELEVMIREILNEYGHFDEEEGVFIYKKKYKDLIPIIAIDDITGIIGENGGSNFKNENAHLISKKLKEIAKSYNALVILGVPSLTSTYKSGGQHISSVSELEPYGTYADRAIILHNPVETNEKVIYGYDVQDFINPTTGNCYMRTAYIAANYMGPSGIYIPYFIYPENGFIMELPACDNVEEIGVFTDLVY